MKAMFVLFLFLFLPSVAGLAVSPGSSTFVEPREAAGSILVTNNEDVTLQLRITSEGETSELVTFTTDEFILEPSTSETVTFVVTAPTRTAAGSYEGGIIVSAQPYGTQESTVAALSAVQHTITVHIPGDEPLLEGKILVSFLAKDKPAFVTVPFQNLGRELASNASVELTIKKPSGDEIHLEKLVGDVAGLADSQAVFSWTPVDLGAHVLTAHITSDEAKRTITSQYTVSVFDLVVDKPIIESGRSGDLLQVDIPVQNVWDRDLHGVYASVRVLKDDEIFGEFSTPNVDVRAQEQITLTGYWNTKHLAAGEYLLQTTVQYGDEAKQQKSVAQLQKARITFVQYAFGFALLLFTGLVIWLVEKRFEKKKRKR